MKRSLLVPPIRSDDPDAARLCEIFDRALARYGAARRSELDGFAARTFSLLPSLAIHRHALGWDLLRAPANIALAPIQLLFMLSGVLARRGGAKNLGARMQRRRILLETDVQREISHRIRHEWLQLPDSENGAVDCALTRELMKEPEMASLHAELGARAARDSAFADRLSRLLRTYGDTRSAAAEITTSGVALGTGLAIMGRATPTALSLGPLLAGTLAHYLAIASFPLGATLGGLYYAFVPVSASFAMTAATTAGAILVAALTGAFAGIIADPVQYLLGLHKRRLLRLLDAFETEIRQGQTSTTFNPRDHYVARLIDLIDLARMVA